MSAAEVFAVVDALPWYVALPFVLGWWLIASALLLGASVTIGAMVARVRTRRLVEQLTRGLLPESRYVRTVSRRVAR